MAVLVDSGVLIRLYETSDPLHPTILAAVVRLRRNGERLVVALQNVAEFWNVCTRPTTARGGLGLTVPRTEGRLRRLERAFSRLSEPNAVYPTWRNLLVTHAVCGKQVHDARLVALMLAHGITHILTLNGADSTRYPGVNVLDPVTVAVPPITP